MAQPAEATLDNIIYSCIGWRFVSDGTSMFAL